MTWDMYQRLYDTCEEVDADDTVRVLVLKGAGGKAFVAGTDIGQFTEFKSGEDGLRYERDGDRRTGRIARVTKPVIAQIQGFAVGGGFGIAAGADIRVATPGCPLRRADRAHPRQLPVDAGLRALRRPARTVAPEGADLHRPADAGRGSARRRLRPRDRRRRGDRGAGPRARRDHRLACADHALGDQGSGAPHPGSAQRAGRRRPDRRDLRQRRFPRRACAPSWRSARRAGRASKRNAPSSRRPSRSARRRSPRRASPRGWSRCARRRGSAPPPRSAPARPKAR